ncbi:GNAT family N-acetyltransferase [Undibacterium sp.]|uniref:GNAT family N-acetyltransferase n=1 Tax=Undibacterium sp. TaxID=1914977 RepID=UPI00374DA1FB
MNTENQALLDTPVWAALESKHAHLRLGGTLARRYHPDVSPFAALASDTPAAVEELHQLMEPGSQVALVTVAPLNPSELVRIERAGTIHQMVALPYRGNAPDRADVLQLGLTDVPEMLELTQKTKPGPFAMRTAEMGNYIGVRHQGRLIAMAGERMQFGGHVEISAVCVDEDFRGQGLAARLMNILRQDIELRGDTPFLHVFDHNQSAITLYERLGFELRQVFHLSRLTRD